MYRASGIHCFVIVVKKGATEAARPQTRFSRFANKRPGKAMLAGPMSFRVPDYLGDPADNADGLAAVGDSFGGLVKTKEMKFGSVGGEIIWKHGW